MICARTDRRQGRSSGSGSVPRDCAGASCRVSRGTELPPRQERGSDEEAERQNGDGLHMRPGGPGAHPRRDEPGRGPDRCQTGHRYSDHPGRPQPAGPAPHGQPRGAAGLPFAAGAQGSPTGRNPAPPRRSAVANQCCDDASALSGSARTLRSLSDFGFESSESCSTLVGREAPPRSRRDESSEGRTAVVRPLARSTRPPPAGVAGSR